MLNITYRKWTYTDILKISQIEEEYFRANAWSFQMLADSFSGNYFYGLGAYDGDEVVGYAFFSIGGDDCDLDKIAVLESYRGNGIGKKLLEKLIAEAKKRGLNKMFLEVGVKNNIAQLLYLSHGFKGLYCRPRYYPDGEDAIVMIKELKE